MYWRPQHVTIEQYKIITFIIITSRSVHRTKQHEENEEEEQEGEATADEEEDEEEHKEEKQ
jgi:hypothetical protein